MSTLSAITFISSSQSHKIVIVVSCQHYITISRGLGLGLIINKMKNQNPMLLHQEKVIIDLITDH